MGPNRESVQVAVVDYFLLESLFVTPCLVDKTDDQG